MISRKQLSILLFFVLFFGIAEIEFSEKIQNHNGLGYDGYSLAYITTHFRQAIIQEKTFTGDDGNTYQMERHTFSKLLPCTIVHFALKYGGFEYSDANVIRAFEIFNLVCILLAVAVWVKISESQKFSAQQFWLGFVALFLNYNVLKWNFYYPVLVDTAAFCSGLLILWLYLTNRRWLLLLFAIVGELIRESNFFMCLLLLVFPREPLPGGRGSAKLHWSILVPVAAGASVMYMFYSYTTGPYATNWRTPSTSDYANLSLALAVMYFSAATYYLFYKRPLFSISSLFSYLQKNWRYMVKWSFILSVVKIGFEWSIRPLIPGRTILPLRLFFDCAAGTATALPLIFMIDHIIFYGPFVILIIMYWRGIADEAWEEGLGFVGVVAMTLLVAIKAESRQHSAFYPFLVVLLIKKLGKESIRTSVVTLLILMSLFYSHVWLKINRPNKWEFMYGIPGSSLASERQYLLWTSYVVIGAILLWITLLQHGLKHTALTEKQAQ